MSETHDREEDVFADEGNESIAEPIEQAEEEVVEAAAEVEEEVVDAADDTANEVIDAAADAVVDAEAEVTESDADAQATPEALEDPVEDGDDSAEPDADADAEPEALEDPVEDEDDHTEPESDAETASVVDDTVDEAEETASVPAAEDMEPEELDLVPEPIADEEMLDEQSGEEEVYEDEGFMSRSFATPILLAAAAAALVLGLIIGRFVLGGSGISSNLKGATTTNEQQLGDVVGSYTYNGETVKITAREVIEFTNGSVSSAKMEDGTYSIPTADYVLNYARNCIIYRDAEAQGLEVQDEEIIQYAMKAGVADLATMADQYGMEESMLREILRRNLLMNKLRDSVVTVDMSITMPDAPTQPAEGKEDKPTADYAQYIINIVGDEWDAKKGTWASKDGVYATALASYEISADAATYEAAQTAYTVAYQQYADAQSQANNEWTSYVNNLFANASIEIGTLLS